MTVLLSDLLRQSNVETVELLERTLAFIPASNVNQGVKDALAEQGVSFYREARELKDKLELMRAKFSPKRWQGIHGRLTKLKEWPFEIPAMYIAYNDLAVWVSGCMRVAEAKNPADVSFYSRNLDGLWQAKLISTALLWPFILKKLKAIKV
jgi:hypothetical protein